MTILIAPIAELTQKFFNSNSLEFDTYFSITPDYQKYCVDSNLLTRFTIGIIGKEATLTHDIAIHLLRGAFKLATGSLKGVCTIGTVVIGQELNYQKPIKEGVIHLGFAFLYTADSFASMANFANRYPQYLIDKIKKSFAYFLKISNTHRMTQEVIIPIPQTEKKPKATEESNPIQENRDHKTLLQTEEKPKITKKKTNLIKGKSLENISSTSQKTKNSFSSPFSSETKPTFLYTPFNISYQRLPRKSVNYQGWNYHENTQRKKNGGSVTDLHCFKRPDVM